MPAGMDMFSMCSRRAPARSAFTESAQTNATVTARNSQGKQIWSGLIFGGAENFGRSYKADNYYETLSPGRGGARFEAAFKQALRQIEAGTITHAKAFEHFHRIILHRFPYILYYRLKDRSHA